MPPTPRRTVTGKPPLKLLLGIWVCLLPWRVLAAPPEPLNILSWEDYIAPEVVDAFERQYHAKINIATFDDEDQRDETLLSTRGRGMDIVCVSEAYVMDPSLMSWIAELDSVQLPNLRYVEYPLADALPYASRYAVPYFWGTSGLAYRSDLLDAAPTGWKDLFSLATKFPGKVVQPANMRMLIGIALLAQGKDFNSEQPADLQLASDSLLAQAPYLYGYQTSDLSENNPLATGEALLAPMFSGDMLTIQAFQPGIRFVYPQEGARVWVDYFVVSKESNHSTLAFKFLNFLNDPNVALNNARYLNFATPNTAAKALADDAYRNNPVIFPPPEVLKKAHLILPVSTQALRRQTEIFVRTLSRFELAQERH